MGSTIPFIMFTNLLPFSVNVTVTEPATGALASKFEVAPDWSSQLNVGYTNFDLHTIINGQQFNS